MYTTKFRKVGGSVMLAVPTAILDLLDLRAGVTVGIAVDGSRLIIEASPRRRYRLEELLAQCDASAEVTIEDREWLDAKPLGAEIL